MKAVKLHRLWADSNQTTGVLVVYDANGQPIFIAPCIERGDRNNEQSVSNVPAGIYPLVLEHSPRFKKDLYELKNVPNRSECKIHASNYWNQLNGCIAPGQALKEISGDGYFDVTNSRNTVASFHEVLDGLKETTIQIIDLV